jgi:HSP20 family protein
MSKSNTLNRTKRDAPWSAMCGRKHGIFPNPKYGERKIAMSENQTPQTSSQDIQNQRGTQNQQNAPVSRSQSGSMARRSYDPFVNPWEFFTGNPFSLMRRMHEEMDNFFSQGARGVGQRGGSFWSPAIDVSEREGKYLVHAELPGLKPEEVKVELRDNMLILQGERRNQHEDNQGGIHRSERSYGQFYRAIPLPENVNPEQVNARFDNGVLEVTVPVPQEQNRSRQIPVQSGGSQPGRMEPGGTQTGTKSSSETGRQNRAA